MVPESRGWGMPEQHLALDAVVAFVDGELSAAARDRAASHLIRCTGCAAEAAAQRQARAAVRAAGAPHM
jgi:anti-sigma factor RsiW